MVDRVKGRAQVEQDERNELAWPLSTAWTISLIVHDEDSCLSRMVTTIRRLPGRQQAVPVMDKAPSDSAFDQF